jgi:hypothetical protein
MGGGEGGTSTKWHVQDAPTEGGGETDNQLTQQQSLWEVGQMIFRDSLVEDYKISRHMGATRWESVMFILNALIAVALCKVLGHKLTSWADAENGSEDVLCDRCGWSAHYYMTGG